MLIVKFILGLIPIIWLIIALTGLKMPGYKACGIAIAFAAAVALFYKHLPPISVATAILEGVCSALWPIILVIIAALFVYALTLETGAMDQIRAMLSSVSRDKRILGLIIGWGFGCFMEGMAGFGTAVAIPASILVTLDFDPLTTVLALLIVNTTPTAFGSVGVPTTSVAATTGLSVNALSASTVQIQLLLLSISPILFIIVLGGGLKALKGMIPFTLIASASFVIPNYIIGAFILLLVTSKLFPFINTPLSAFSSKVNLYVGEGATPTSFSWINTPGIWIILSGIIGGLIQGASIGKIFRVFTATIRRNVKTILTVCAVLSTAKIMVHSGMTTGSGTSTGVLFGPLQAASAAQLGLPAEWLCAANAMGAGIGKMIAPSNIALATAAAGLPGRENEILGGIFKFCILYAVLGGIVCFVFA